MAGGPKANTWASLMPMKKSTVQPAHHFQGGFLPLVQSLRETKNKAGIGCHAAGQQAEPVAVVINATSSYFWMIFFHLFGHHIGPLQGGGIGQLDVDHQVAHVLFRHEPAGQQFAHERAGGRRSDQAMKPGRWRFCGSRCG
jgi:hypothetical protein